MGKVIGYNAVNVVFLACFQVTKRKLNNAALKISFYA